ncbi:hypothetical protein B0H11DRAFT_1938783 [Mycena galericulata]|nr:hypothetical protein B0H11DRAFT_1938783 [Mycena galericulata]
MSKNEWNHPLRRKRSRRDEQKGCDAMGGNTVPNAPDVLGAILSIIFSRIRLAPIMMDGIAPERLGYRDRIRVQTSTGKAVHLSDGDVPFSVAAMISINAGKYIMGKMLVWRGDKGIEIVRHRTAAMETAVGNPGRKRYYHHHLLFSGWPVTRTRCPALPTEVWTLILYAYCGGFDVHPYYYNHRRELLRQLNSEWKRLIDADGLFWCRVVVNASISVNSLQSHVECIRGRRMDVSIDLNHLLAYSTNSQCGADHPRYKHTRRLLSTLAPTSHLWRHVTVSSACVTFMRLILDVIRPLQAPSLEHLTFRAVQHGSMETMHDLFTTPPVIFNNNTPRLLQLRLVSATISWTSANIYSSLTVSKL